MSDRPRLFLDTRDLLDAFDAAAVEYVVVGAHALAAHGLPRATGDFDVLIRPSPENAARVMQALDELGAPTRAHGVVEEDFATAGAVYQIGLPPRRIDLLTHISGVPFEAAWASRMECGVDGRRLSVLGRATLIQNKRASGRPKDLLDVAALESSGG